MYLLNFCVLSCNSSLKSQRSGHQWCDDDYIYNQIISLFSKLLDGDVTIHNAIFKKDWVLASFFWVNFPISLMGESPLTPSKSKITPCMKLLLVLCKLVIVN